MSAVSANSLKIAVYLAFVGGLGVLCLEISSFAGKTALALAAPHLAAPVPAERPVTLVEQRRRTFETRVAVKLEPEPLIPAPARPSIPLTELASAMDQAEQTDLAESSQVSRRVRKAKAPSAVATRVAAADVFGQSFGVMLRASR
jgi:hypothetical protein